MKPSGAIGYEYHNATDRFTRQSKTDPRVVDDHKDTCLVVERLLRSAGLLAECITSPLEALERLQTVIPAAMLLDIMMPEMSGIELLRLVRTNPRTAHIPVLMMTATSKRSRPSGSQPSRGAGDHPQSPVRLVTAPRARAALPCLAAPRRSYPPRAPRCRHRRGPNLEA